jgi:hypothetical protein
MGGGPSSGTGDGRGSSELSFRTGTVLLLSSFVQGQHRRQLHGLRQVTWFQFTCDKNYHPSLFDFGYDLTW